MTRCLAGAIPQSGLPGARPGGRGRPSRRGGRGQTRTVDLWLIQTSPAHQANLPLPGTQDSQKFNEVPIVPQCSVSESATICNTGIQAPDRTSLGCPGAPYLKYAHLGRPSGTPGHSKTCPSRPDPFSGKSHVCIGFKWPRSPKHEGGSCPGWRWHCAQVPGSHLRPLRAALQFSIPDRTIVPQIPPVCAPRPPRGRAAAKASRSSSFSTRTG
jgi:hypothetical protein